MLSLGTYESSDEESGQSAQERSRIEQSEAIPQGSQGEAPRTSSGAGDQGLPSIGGSASENGGSIGAQVSRPSQSEPLKSLSDAPLEGPMVGPSIPQPYDNGANGDSSQPQSPYSSTRALVRDLTLPPIPNLDIPLSPPGSPSPKTSSKFANFLELKKKGVHFNGKLANSSSLKNPSLLQKLTSFAGIDEKGQYASTLPKDLWDPEAFPEWAYKEGLAKSQKELLKQKEEERAKVQRDAVDFVPATASNESSRGGTPGQSGGGKGLGRSAAERVMAGLGREKARSPMVSDGQKRRDPERRPGKYDNYRSRDRSRSRSTDKRRRSRSR
ncbi:MAG: hypothetical protein M4579_004400 [Chaenotheca gracillima]|nr:MAG: hypothetical protein M4579_004400 [Chaenotheca gracillima]